MKQIVNIFRTDARHFWPEILLSLAILAVLVGVYPLQWPPAPATVWASDNNRMLTLAMLSRTLTALLLISWAVLVARVIHVEALVGDRQFWITRPYEWKKLLAAKLLFLLAFLYLPLMIAQWLILAEVGFNPSASIPGMLFNLLLVTGIVVAPLLAIAAVTADFFRMAFTLFAIALAGVAACLTLFLQSDSMHSSSIFGYLLFFVIGNMLAREQASTASIHHPQLWVALVMLTVCGAVVVLQYARRKVWLGRAALLALPVALCIAVLVSPRSTLSEHLDRDYPPMAAGAAAPVLLSYGPDEHHPLYVSKNENPVGIRVPIHVSGIASDGAVSMEPYPSVSITAADGYNWSGKVTDFYPTKFVPTSTHTGAGFTIPRAIYDRLKTSLVTVRITFALTQLRAEATARIPLPTRDVAVPGIGVCGTHTLGYAMLACRSAWRDPQILYASADWSSTPCPAGQTEIEQVRGDYWAGQLEREPAQFGIIPIMGWSVSFMPDLNNATGGKYLCPGAPITFTQYKLAGRSQTSVTLTDFKLPDD